jgi:hypothetical protein
MPSAEFELLDRIRRLASPTERSQLIDELDSIRGPEIALFRLWTRVHETWQFDGWTDDGYYASKVDLARDIQLLSATEYGVSDIENGGLHQFFWNGTGVFAPEMIEWFDRAGMPEAAEILRKAVGRFGPVYPRSQGDRQEFLDGFEGKSRAEWDPFYELDDPFFVVLRPNEAQPTHFEVMADRWLHETCGIKKLGDPPRTAHPD